jgi:hypothetical protein
MQRKDALSSQAGIIKENCCHLQKKAAQGCAVESGRNYQRKLLPLTEKAAQGCAVESSRNFRRKLLQKNKIHGWILFFANPSNSYMLVQSRFRQSYQTAL